jgi:maltodextrin utilization protein YvdJ
MEKVNYGPLVNTSANKVRLDPNRHGIVKQDTYSTSEHYHGNATKSAMISHSDYNGYVNTHEALCTAAAVIGHKNFDRNPEDLLVLH